MGVMAAAAPILYVDVDGVLSLFCAPGEPAPLRPDTRGMIIDGIPHLIALENCARLKELADHFELVWATGWEEKANDYLLSVVGLEEELEVIRFKTAKYDHQAHWKLGALDAHAGNRPVAWIDDALDDECRAWAYSRGAPTLLVQTDFREGLADRHFAQLVEFARSLSAQRD